MALIESEADAIAWVHQMAKTPTTGDHEVADPHPYCLGDDPCCCVQLIAACETARADEREKAAGRVEARYAKARATGEAAYSYGALYEDRILATLQIVHTLGVE